jgi:N-acetylglucosaminyldiphosphoundecaprenol N-acetyl-beta-D-mannosaminyltransferase
VRVAALQIPDVIQRMQEWILQRDGGHFIAVANVHVMMEAQHDPSFRKVLETAALCVPDGMPLVWVGRIRGHPLQRRVYGPDLLVDFCQQTQEMGYRHFFYGGAPGVPEAMTERLKKRFPRLNVVGSYSPPFRHLTAEEDARQIEMIRLAEPDVLWVGLGCPKQERWISAHLDRLEVPIILGVGQAFDIHSGRSKQAPGWLREHGLEWLYRLVAEPRRLWRRYLLYNSQFIVCESLEILGLKRFG